MSLRKADRKTGEVPLTTMTAQGGINCQELGRFLMCFMEIAVKSVSKIGSGDRDKILSRSGWRAIPSTEDVVRTGHVGLRITKNTIEACHVGRTLPDDVRRCSLALVSSGVFGGGYIMLETKPGSAKPTSIVGLIGGKSYRICEEFVS